MLAMATRNKDAAAEQPKRYRVKSQICGRVASPELADALNAYFADHRPSPKIATLVTTAVEDFLKGLGYWPDPKGR